MLLSTWVVVTERERRRRSSCEPSIHHYTVSRVRFGGTRPNFLSFSSSLFDYFLSFLIKKRRVGTDPRSVPRRLAQTRPDTQKMRMKKILPLAGDRSIKRTRSQLSNPVGVEYRDILLLLARLATTIQADSLRPSIRRPFNRENNITRRPPAVRTPLPSSWKIKTSSSSSSTCFLFSSSSERAQKQINTHGTHFTQQLVHKSVQTIIKLAGSHSTRKHDFAD